LNPNDGWTDAIDTLYGDEPTYTHWDCFRLRWERNSGLRTDHSSPSLHRCSSNTDGPLLRTLFAMTVRWISEVPSKIL
jgi:hypothetical protein